MDNRFDVIVIGGGINGCGIAADAAQRGLSVLLIEKDDLASKTSSSSTKLIHGGLRYLEYYQFSLVKKSLDERQLLSTLAPHLITAQAFVLPHHPSMRPTWLLRLGLYLYDNLSRINTLPKSRLIKRLKDRLLFLPLNKRFQKGFLYYDCKTDDARLTIANALQAKQFGATVLTQTELIKASAENNLWHLTVKTQHHQPHILLAKSVINAAGPWVPPVNRLLGIPLQYDISLIKGSHIVVPRIYDGEQGYVLQSTDKRIVFVIPWHECSMIGTTDLAFSEDPEKLSISPDEIRYLLQLTASYFDCSLSEKDILYSWSGVRPLLASPSHSPQALSRDYSWHFSHSPAPVITIYGGKITTYRQLARDAVNELLAIFPTLKSSTTDASFLPGATMDGLSWQSYQQQANQTYAWLDKTILARLLSTYGTRVDLILNDCQHHSDLGIEFGHGLFQREVDYLLKQEWAINSDDILWRRTKLGLLFNQENTKTLNRYLNDTTNHLL